MSEPPSLFKMDFFDGFKVARLFKGLKTPWGGPPQTADDLLISERIARLEKALLEQPKDWFLLDAIGELYAKSGQLCLALKVVKEAYDLRPLDSRSTFALASVYRYFVRAKWLNYPKEMIFDRNLFPDELTWKTMLDSFNPEGANDELIKSGLTLDEAALKAMYYFEETLHLGVRADEVKFVNECLQKMYTDFPHLEIRVKNIINQKYAAKKSRGVEDSLLTEAIGHYTRLRFLFDTPPKYRYELGEVIRLCQWGIAVDKNVGDLYVLLANGFSLLDACINSSMSDHEYYKRMAAVILLHWSEKSLKEFTTPPNVIIGDKLFEDIISSLILIHDVNRDAMISLVRTYSDEYLPEAFSPASFEKIKTMLMAEPI